MVDIVEVSGGIAIKYDLWEHKFHEYNYRYCKNFACAIIDGPYGENIVKSDYDSIDGHNLMVNYSWLMSELVSHALPGAHAWIWGGIGTPGCRALYKTLIQIELEGAWKCAEQITWHKKRGYGTNWRCLMTREECLRFVLGDPKKPRVYHPQYSTEKRGYAGFNKKYPCKSEYKRLGMIWNHASDMGQNKPHQCHKPKPLAQTQILSTTNPGDLVLDLFSGSGEVSLTARIRSTIRSDRKR